MLSRKESELDGLEKSQSIYRAQRNDTWREGPETHGDTQPHKDRGLEASELVVFVTAAALGNDTPFQFMAASIQETKQILALSFYMSLSLEISGLPFALQTQFSGKSKRGSH